MRLWDYRLLKVLPDRFIVSQWRECIAIKRQWEKGTLKHRLVSYVKDYSKTMFFAYVDIITFEMFNRDIKFNNNLMIEIMEFCKYEKDINYENYPEHNYRYLKQCYYNLQEKYDRGIISEDEWQRIEDYYAFETMGLEDET